MLRTFPSAVIENLQPLIDGGRYPIKRVTGEDLMVEADIFKEGHDVVAAALKWRMVGESSWHETPMTLIDNDRWRGTCTFYENAIYEYTVEAWIDAFTGWQHEFSTKFKAGVTPLRSEALEGAALIEEAAGRAHDPHDASRLCEIAEAVRTKVPAEVDQLVHSGELEVLMATYPDRTGATQWAPPPRVVVDRLKARTAAWYEFFPRSAEGSGERGSKLRDCLPRIEYAKTMGFNVIYFPPIHPIGTTNRKGRNNSVISQPDDPGVPYAIGNRHLGLPNGGGHKDIDPALGTLEDFAWLEEEVRKRGLEIALDFAINCSPDHPYVVEHPEWFYERPDGTIKFAENPPKKYEDIYPLNFRCQNWPELWAEMKSIILFWVERGVRIFRVDNPHTKPVPFWEYLISGVREEFPDTIFLSEAFTRPKIMKVLAKAGFNQSYTYFTWRNQKQELIDYFSELTQTQMREYFRGNLWPNTPDILPPILQSGGRPAFMIRAVLAATLSSVYGIYSGFELCENVAVREGSEEYLDSEKYQIRVRNLDQSGSLSELITRVNMIRREHPALQHDRGLRFHETDNRQLLCYSKQSTDGRDRLTMVVNLDPFNMQHGFVRLPLSAWRLPSDSAFEVVDLLSNERYFWRGEWNYVRLDPQGRMAHILQMP
jgi:starch synthase (maltosyl-transferring)